MDPKLADKPQASIDDKLDEASALSFPASDPPFFMGSTAIAGARRSVVVLAPRLPAAAGEKNPRDHIAGVV